MTATLWLWNVMRKQFYFMHPAELALDDSDPEPKWLHSEGVLGFAILIALETVIARGILHRDGYRFREMVSSAALGAFQTAFHFSGSTLLKYAGFSVGATCRKRYPALLFRTFCSKSRNHDSGVLGSHWALQITAGACFEAT